jgi:DNA repair exonuclease SbcCD ATPase subunit
MDVPFLTRQRKDRSTFERKYMDRCRNAPDKRIGIPGLSPQLVHKQKEMEVANSQLDDARTKFEQWKTNFQHKRKELEEEQQTLNDQKKQLDTFTQHHLSELERAKRRELDEVEKAREIEKELKSLNDREEALKAKNEYLSAELRKLQPCSDYLQLVVESCQTFDNIEAILHRYESLANTRAEYLLKYQQLMAGYGDDEAELAKILDVRESYLIGSTMKYNERLNRIKQTRKMNEYRNTTMMKDVQRIEDKITEIAAIKTSIRTIYRRAVSRSSGVAVDIQKKRGELSEEAMLMYVENKFLDLRDIIKDAPSGMNVERRGSPS